MTRINGREVATVDVEDLARWHALVQVSAGKKFKNVKTEEEYLESLDKTVLGPSKAPRPGVAKRLREEFEFVDAADKLNVGMLAVFERETKILSIHVDGLEYESDWNTVDSLAMLINAVGGVVAKRAEEKLKVLHDFVVKAKKSDKASGFTKVVVAGHSAGGILAKWLTIRHEELVDQVVAISSPGAGGILGSIRQTKSGPQRHARIVEIHFGADIVTSMGRGQGTVFRVANLRVWPKHRLKIAYEYVNRYRRSQQSLGWRIDRAGLHVGCLWMIGAR